VDQDQLAAVLKVVDPGWRSFFELLAAGCRLWREAPARVAAGVQRRHHEPVEDEHRRACELGRLTIRFAVGQPPTALRRGQRWVTQWDETDWITVQALPERSRVTASRAIGLGLLALGAKKRTPFVRDDCHMGHAAPRL
jgi:hypothetical protein